MNIVYIRHSCFLISWLKKSGNVSDIAVSRKRRGSAMDEHGRPLPQPARDLRLLLAAILYGNEGDDQPLPRDSWRGSARR